MRVAVRALIASPPRLSCSVRLDEAVGEMSILGMIPLALQQWAEQADVRALPLADASVLIWGVVLMEPALIECRISGPVVAAQHWRLT